MASDGRQPHILCVNDTQEVLDLLRELLEDEGYRVTTAMEMFDLDRVRELAPDVIVQDLLFEQTQDRGWKFLTLVRLDPELSRIPLILCTAAVAVIRDEAMAANLRQLGVRVVLKPFNIEDLLAALATVLREQDAAHADEQTTP